jgi:DNA-binding response OmpR family regulator
MKKILIVEDEQALLDLLVEQFKSEDFDVISAVDGKQGLEKVKSVKPDLVLLDIIMPVLDGMSMLTEMRKNDWGKNVPVIMLTNLSDDEKVADCAEKGVYEYLIKSDWSMEDVVKKVRQKLGM